MISPRQRAVVPESANFISYKPQKSSPDCVGPAVFGMPRSLVVVAVGTAMAGSYGNLNRLAVAHEYRLDHARAQQLAANFDLAMVAGLLRYPRERDRLLERW